MNEIDRYKANILRTYSLASDSDVTAGMNWYPQTHDFAATLSPNDPWKAAGVLAIFSARTPWNRNMELAQRLFDTGIAPGHMFTEHAQRMHDGEPVLSVLKGDKTRAFASAIATGGEWDTATIDGHAYDIADGRLWGKSRPSIGKRVYRDMALAYSECAIVTGFEFVTQLQAITWVAHRRIYGFDWRG